ncbi:MAG: hypothetical protein IPO67_15135 [Deltaproteobacteria bacterium]|nr:hypothetical protein [Deltaproteobacteria bacterium]
MRPVASPRAPSSPWPPPTWDELLIELGVDLVVASDGEPWLIELNGRPGGRLSGLAAADPARFQDAATEALARPLRALAALI